MSRQQEFDAAAAKAAGETDRALTGEESQLQVPTWNAIRRMLPEPLDQAELDELRRIVDATTDHNQKVAELNRSIHRVGGALVKVLEKLR